MKPSFNATAEGQVKMCRDAEARATAFILNNFVRSHGGDAWDAKTIETANDAMLAAIKADLLEAYNKLTTAQK